MENQGRRDFFKKMGQLAVSASALQACQSLDRWIMGSEEDDPRRVIIMGGGLAGLAAADYLHRHQVPFSLLEGSNRWGGRVLSLNDFDIVAQTADLGGEWIFPGQDTILNLAKELRLELEIRQWQLADFASDLSAPSGKNSQWHRLIPDWNTFQKNLDKKRQEIFGRSALRLTRMNADTLPLARYLNEKNLDQHLFDIKTLPEIHHIVKRAFEVQLGTSTQNISALALYDTTMRSNSVYWPSNNKAFRFVGGSGALVQALVDRVKGIIPGRRLSLNAKVFSIEKTQDGYALGVMADGKKVELKSRYVICALPPPIIKTLDGYSNLPASEAEIHALDRARWGSPAKGAMTFPDRPWKKKLNITRWVQGALPVGFAEVEPRTDRVAGTTRSILSFQWGGDSSNHFGESEVEKVPEILKAIDLDLETKSISSFNWELNPWSKSGIVYSPPEKDFFTAGAWNQEPSSFVFVGEHTSVLFPGTMNGAIESGAFAAQRIMKRMFG